MEVHFATTNAGKVYSLEKALEQYNIKVIHANIDLDELRSDSVYFIAAKKVRDAFMKINKPVVAIDAGFSINVLNGFPNTYVNSTLKTIGIKGILKLMQNNKDRRCEFSQCLAYTDKEMHPDLICFNELIHGTLAAEKKGSNTTNLWSELGFIFIPKGIEKTLAEMSEEEYINWKSKNQDENYYINRFGNWFLSRNQRLGYTQYEDY